MVINKINLSTNVNTHFGKSKKFEEENKSQKNETEINDIKKKKSPMTAIGTFVLSGIDVINKNIKRKNIQKQAPSVITNDKSDTDASTKVQKENNIDNITPQQIQELKNQADEVTFETFKILGGNFYRGEAYIDDEPYTGDIVFYNGKEKTTVNYQDGTINTSTVYEKISDGTYEPKEIKKYRIDDMGNFIIEKNKRKYKLDAGEHKFDDVWFTDEIVKIKPSEITVLRHTPFNDYLCTCMKKQQDGSWKGYYESREFDSKLLKYQIVHRDVGTGAILNKREMKRFIQ